MKITRRGLIEMAVVVPAAAGMTQIIKPEAPAQVPASQQSDGLVYGISLLNSNGDEVVPIQTCIDTEEPPEVTWRQNAVGSEDIVAYRIYLPEALQEFFPPIDRKFDKCGLRNPLSLRDGDITIMFDEGIVDYSLS